MFRKPELTPKPDTALWGNLCAITFCAPSFSSIAGQQVFGGERGGMEDRAAMLTGHRFRAGLCLAAVMLSFSPVAAEDTASAVTGTVRPSVEELAIPQSKTPDIARESDIREAMCLMIESAARAN